MTEFKLTIEASDIADAIRTLAVAIQSRGIATEPEKAIAKKNTAKTTPATTAPVAPVTAEAPVNPIPMTAPVIPQNVPVAPAPTVPTTPVTTSYPSNPPITLDVLSNAGAGLLEKGMMPQLMALLGKYGVQAITQLKPDQYPAFASELRAMGALI